MGQGTEKKFHASSTALTGVLLAGVLALVLAVLAVTTHQRLSMTREMQAHLLDMHGSRIVKGLERASRAGMRRGLYRLELLQALVEEMAGDPKVGSLAVLTRDGRILAWGGQDQGEQDVNDPLAGLPEEIKSSVERQKPFSGFLGDAFFVGRPLDPFKLYRLRGRDLPPWACPMDQKEPLRPDAPGRRGEQGRGPDAGHWKNGNPPWNRHGPGHEGGRRHWAGRGPDRGEPLPGGRMEMPMTYALVRLSIAEYQKDVDSAVVDAVLMAGLLFLGAGGAAFFMWGAARKRDREIQRLRKEVAESEHLAAVGRLAGSVAHEVRNPLSALRGLVQLLGKGREPGSKQAEYAAVAVSEVDRLERVVSGLLEYTRPRKPSLVNMDLGESLRSAVDLMADDPRASGVEMVLDIADGPITVSADPDQIRQVVLNLVVNALEALNGSGRLEISALKQAETWRVKVADNGPGLPKGGVEHLFDPFYSTKERGTGLGLAIARRIVQAHGGNLEAAAPPLGGAEFSFSLPAGGGGQ